MFNISNDKNTDTAMASHFSLLYYMLSTEDPQQNSGNITKRKNLAATLKLEKHFKILFRN